MNRIIEIAETWLRTPYHPGASKKGIGVDCAMLLVEVFHEANDIERPEIAPYSPDWHLHRSEEIYLEWIKKYCDPIEKPGPGDIGMFQYGHTQSHGAIIVEWPIIIHAFYGRGVIIDDGEKGYMRDKKDRSRLRGFWRVR